MEPAHSIENPPASGGPPSQTLRPARMTTTETAAYLQQTAGVPVKEKTLQNWRAAGTGPKPVYLGNLPLYEVGEVDRWLAEEAFQPESTITRRNKTRVPAAGRQLE